MKELVVTKAAVTTYLQFLKIQEKSNRGIGRDLWYERGTGEKI